MCPSYSSWHLMILIAALAHLLMWLLCTVFRALNQQPGEGRGADVTRVRMPFLEGRGAELRQNILLSAWPSAELNAAFQRLCCSAAGKARLKHAPQACPSPWCHAGHAQLIDSEWRPWGCTDSAAPEHEHGTVRANDGNGCLCRACCMRWAKGRSRPVSACLPPDTPDHSRAWLHGSAPWPHHFKPITAAASKQGGAVQGVLHAVGQGVQQVFQRLPAASPSAAAEAHYHHFVSSVWPRLKGSGAAGRWPSTLAVSWEQEEWAEVMSDRISRAARLLHCTSVQSAISRQHQDWRVTEPLGSQAHLHACSRL